MASHAAEVKMPQTSNIQREPSMEEILASIRRIIEDSDQVRKPEPQHAASPGVLRHGEVEAVGDNDAERSFHGSPIRHAPPYAPIEEAAPYVAERPVEEEPAIAPVSFQPAVKPEAAEPDAELQDEDILGAMDDDIDAGLPPIAANSADPVGSLPSKPFEAQTIISERTGRQVAAAFEELSDAFAASRRKTFDEIASEMMRPMLQDWLDNNLPTLVEKLVREEIERVARGATR